MGTTATRLRAAPNLNYLWAGLLVEELVRQGVGLFVLAPGSRSTPLTLAVAAHPGARHLMHFDERGTAFAALGFARATGRPAVWITTSGTAVANGLPAAVEAATDGVPLLLLTADRPPELRETGANQTIRQPHLFGEYSRWAFDLPVPTADIAPAFVLTTAAHAVHRSKHPAGPVHLNVMFREPLAPEPDGTDVQDLLAPLAGWLVSEQPYTHYAPPASSSVSDETIQQLAGQVQGSEHGLVVLGKTDDPQAAPAAGQLAATLGWPLIADVASGGRLGPSAPTSVPYADLVLTSARFRETQVPEAVLHLGGRATSKRLLQFIEAARPGFYAVVRPDAERFDPTHQVTDRIQTEIAAFCTALNQALGPATNPSDWLMRWRHASEAIGVMLEADLDGGSLSEPLVARRVSRWTPEGHGLVVASSMPVRDLDTFGEAGHGAVRVTANRGASGIDGLVATAAGFARGLGRPTTLLIGDLALLYDLNSLALLRDGPPVTVVVVNNDGGGIFHFLPVAAHEIPFEPYFGTPHGLHFEAAARMFGLGYARPETPEAFVADYRVAMGSTASTLIEVRTDRRDNVALHRALAARASQAVDHTLERGRRHLRWPNSGLTTRRPYCSCTASSGVARTGIPSPATLLATSDC